MRIIDLDIKDDELVQQCASILVDAFREHWPNAWPDQNSALLEVKDAIQTGKIARVAVDDSGSALGWIGATSKYNGHTWELHPLAVHPNAQGNRIGTALVADLAEQVKQRGGMTIYLGTDDEDGMTSLANVDIYDNVQEHLMTIKNLKRHPFGFYLKLGFSIVGVIPDANGLGKPDIIMARRVG